MVHRPSGHPQESNHKSLLINKGYPLTQKITNGGHVLDKMDVLSRLEKKEQPLGMHSRCFDIKYYNIQ
jgi:hypothetical protein